jgi:hypothetical protein
VDERQAGFRAAQLKKGSQIMAPVVTEAIIIEKMGFVSRVNF